MRKTIIIALALLYAFVPCRLDAQSRSEERRAKAAAFNTVEQYVDLSQVYDEDQYYYFLQLFRDRDNSTVFAGDLMLGYENDNVISPQEYASRMLTSVESPAVNIRNMVIGKPEYFGGEWSVKVTFDKSINYLTGEILVSSDEYYRNDFNMSIDLVYDPETDKCLIDRVNGRIDTDMPAFPMNFWVIKPSNKPEYDAKLLSDGNNVVFNDFDVAIVRAGSVEYKDKGTDIRIKTDTLARGDRYRIIKYNYNPIKNRLIVHGGMSPMGYFKIKDNKILSSKSSCWDYGVDLGHTWGMGENVRSRMGFFIGAGMSVSDLDMKYDKVSSYKLEYGTSSNSGVKDRLPSDAFTYTTTVNINSVSESLSSKDIYVPIYFNFEHPLLPGSNRLTLFWNVGVRTYVNLSTKSSPQIVDGTLNGESLGEYSSYIMPVNQVHHLHAALNKNAVRGREKLNFLKKAHVDFSAVANLGFSVRCAGLLYLNASVGYEYGLTPMFQTEEIYNYNKNSEVNEFINKNVWGLETPQPYVVDDKGKVMALSSFLNSVSLYRQGFRANVGLMLKF